MKCFEIASDIIEEATKRFNPIWKLNTEKQKIFKQYCAAVDKILDEFDGKSFEVEVDEITMNITVIVECDEIIIESNQHPLYGLMERAIRSSFSSAGNDTIYVKFVFPSLWDRA